jgi:hypothetical protein
MDDTGQSLGTESNAAVGQVPVSAKGQLLAGKVSHPDESQPAVSMIISISMFHHSYSPVSK